ncbi:MAG TPA: hypothetical protein EYH02_00450 [Ignisphaera aggregans]|uniref:HEPN domain-containing protein n=1 Tax=Ignisphaera aggregans TaxID=334771 RepID=A0A832YXT6_9CREN|nr:hypothetical protein [Ignisphaera aggregans]
MDTDKDDEKPSGGGKVMKSDPELSWNAKANELIEKALQYSADIAVILLLSAAEIAASAIIVCSKERKLRTNLCRLSTKKRLNRALSILRREGYVSHQEYLLIRRVLRDLRCIRNSMLHPICVERCSETDLSSAIGVVKRFIALADRYVVEKCRPSAAADSAIR